MRFSKNSWEAFRGEFGINQLTSRIFTLTEDRRSCNPFGVTSKGALEYIDLDMDCTLYALGTRLKAAGRNAERIILKSEGLTSYALAAQNQNGISVRECCRCRSQSLNDKPRLVTDEDAF
jgi:hypothetical protein